MENKKHLYIVTFGDSDSYRLYIPEDTPEGAVRDAKVLDIEKELNDFLKDKFQDSAFTYFTTPRVREIDFSDEYEYAQYPQLDENAVAELKRKLATEVEVMEAEKELDRNAPFDKI